MNNYSILIEMSVFNMKLNVDSYKKYENHLLYIVIFINFNLKMMYKIKSL